MKFYFFPIQNGNPGKKSMKKVGNSGDKPEDSLRLILYLAVIPDTSPIRTITFGN
ncbi:MAG TPA: hypothetical protein VKZ56_07285 [Membranihabitans sp.]|nr:hypothetical protein [Membranihabitans sp.]